MSMDDDIACDFDGYVSCDPLKGSDRTNATHTLDNYLVQVLTDMKYFLTDISEYNPSLFDKSDYLVCTSDVAKLITSEFSPFYYKNVTYIPYDRCVGSIIKNEKLKKVPKLLEWPVEFRKKNVFNPGIIGYKDGKYTPYITDDDKIIISPRISDGKSGKSELYLYIYDMSYNFQNSIMEIKTDDPWSKEDPRLFIFKNDLYLSSSYILGMKNNIDKILCKISYCNLSNNTQNIIPSFGGNLHNIGGKGWEKNWMFFEHKNKLLSIYSNTPWKIIDCTNETNISTVCECIIGISQNIKLHGGTPPIKYNDDYIIFCHKAGTYEIYVIIFDSETLKPKQYGLLISRNDLYLKQNFVFISGAIIKNNNTFILSGGINDYGIVMFEFTFDEIESILEPVSCTEI